MLIDLQKFLHYLFSEEILYTHHKDPP